MAYEQRDNRGPRDGGPGRDTLHGWGGNDTLVGGEGGDKLYGEAGYDRLAGGPGDDWMDAGSRAEPAAVLKLPTSNCIGIGTSL